MVDWMDQMMVVLKGLKLVDLWVCLKVDLKASMKVEMLDVVKVETSA
jgi:hypothetical protein